MIRKCIVAGMGAVASLLGLSAVASAQPILSIFFDAQNGVAIPRTDTVIGAPGDTLSAVIELDLTNVPGGSAGFGLSVEFDADLGNELDIILDSVRELTPPGFPLHFTPGVQSIQESTAEVPGRLLSFEAIPLLGTAAGGGSTFDIARVDFLVTGNVATDGPDICPGLFNRGVDAILGADFLPIMDVVFSPATVNGLGPFGATSACATTASGVPGPDPAPPQAIEDPATEDPATEAPGIPDGPESWEPGIATGYPDRFSNTATVPEPATALLLGVGLLGFGFGGHRWLSPGPR